MRITLPNGEVRDEIVTKIFNTVQLEKNHGNLNIDLLSPQASLSSWGNTHFLINNNEVQSVKSARIFAISLEAFAQNETDLQILCEKTVVSLIIGEKLYWESIIRPENTLSPLSQNTYLFLHDKLCYPFLTDPNDKHFIDVPPLQKLNMLTINNDLKNKDKICLRATLDCIIRRPIN